MRRTLKTLVLLLGHTTTEEVVTVSPGYRIEIYKAWGQDLAPCLGSEAWGWTISSEEGREKHRKFVDVAQVQNLSCFLQVRCVSSFLQGYGVTLPASSKKVSLATQS